ncbi:Paraquat-inducible protein A [Tistlia consotensis]|uniref:Paraquat-inducible protein A n=1 Tax=Tistlia consotensis USBA 355 TaxID=560819 RepID=A0A1Y6CQC3_9PROT|nr:paraquat-inducible protein A [Tistlia consotensis]SMF65424.1 Paraquat-inducible protein A [Tistlia consotensis USBA 355]SNS03723.1 Paraquat-inducible protein A [Tistlia consotensis]
MVLPLLLLAALGLLAAGVTEPIVTVDTLLLLSRPYSILDVTLRLFEAGEWPIASIVGAFSLVLPTAKLLLMLGLWARLRLGRGVPARLLDVLETVARWSMLDVLAAALIVFTLKSGALTDAHFEPGIYFFLASIALTSLCSLLLKRRARDAGAAAQMPR